MTSIPNEVLRADRVEARDPAADAPGDVIAKAVVHNVERPEVADLPRVKLGQVDHLDAVRDPHGRAHRAVQLILLEHVDSEEHRPRHHAKAAVEKVLEVNRAKVRVQLHAPIVVHDDVAARAIVRRVRALVRREQIALQNACART